MIIGIPDVFDILGLSFDLLISLVMKKLIEHLVEVHSWCHLCNILVQRCKKVIE
jgi:hypothetical protein